MLCSTYSQLGDTPNTYMHVQGVYNPGEKYATLAKTKGPILING